MSAIFRLRTSSTNEFEQAAAGDKQLLVADLKAFAADRNQLVHHFYRNPSFDLTATDGATAAIAYLNEQYERIRDWLPIFRTQAAAILLALMQADPKLAAQLAPHRDKLMAQFPQAEGTDFFIK